ncbi:MAG: glycosyltransferase [Faecalibacterium sp.]
MELYQGMDAFFLPSFFEGLPVTGVEAQAMGLSMVVSDTVTREMVYTDLVDYVSLNDTPEAWAKSA